MRTPKKALLLGVVLALAPLGVAAEEAAPTPYPECTKQVNDADRDAAKAAFNVGTASYNEGDYQRAIQYWEDAYRRDCSAHALLLNLARALESNGQKLHAVYALETYLARSGDTAQKDQIQRRIQLLRDKIQAEKAAATPTVTAPTATATSTPAPTTTASAAPEDTGGKKPIYPLFIAGGGAVLAIVGGVVYAGGKADVKDSEAACPNRKCPASRQDLVDKGESGRSRQTVGGFVAITGVGLVVTGVIWYLALKPRPAKTGLASHSTAVAPSIGPGFAGLQLNSSF